MSASDGGDWNAVINECVVNRSTMYGTVFGVLKLLLLNMWVMAVARERDSDQDILERLYILSNPFNALFLSTNHTQMIHLRLETSRRRRGLMVRRCFPVAKTVGSSPIAVVLMFFCLSLQKECE